MAIVPLFSYPNKCSSFDMPTLSMIEPSQPEDADVSDCYEGIIYNVV
jgi:hypothetical protein